MQLINKRVELGNKAHEAIRNYARARERKPY